MEPFSFLHINLPYLQVVEARLLNLVGEMMTNTRKNIAVEVAASEEADDNKKIKISL